MAAIAAYYQRAKNGLHALQALLIFLGAVITIALYTKGGRGDGRINYYFILCWLCIPGLIYQSAFPIFERTKRFANSYAHAVVDLLFTILWFAAFIAVFVWVRQGSHAAKGWDSKKDKLCDKFDWGPTSKCKLGQVTGGIGVFICLLFILTTGMSTYGIIYYRKNGAAPAYVTRGPEAIPAEDNDDYNFSSNPHDKLDEQEELQPMHRDRDDVSSLHMMPEGDNQQDGRMSWDRQPTPEPPIHRERPVSWAKASPPELPMHRERPMSWGGQSTLEVPGHHDQSMTDWNRPATPELPLGEGFYPVDTSYRGSGKTPYEPSRQHKPSGSVGRAPNPLYDPFHSNENDFIGGSTPKPTQSHKDPFDDEMESGHGYSLESRIDFPDAEYGR